MPTGGGVDVKDIAYAVLHPDSDGVNNRLARSYYARLDSAARQASKQEEKT